MKWDKYTIQTTTQAEDLISAVLAELGIEGIEITDCVPLTKEDMAKMFIDILPQTQPDNGIGYVSFYLEGGKDHTALLVQVSDELSALSEWTDIGAGTITKSETEDADWMNNWKEFFHPFFIGDIYIRPTWEEKAPESDARVTIVIDPGISFGTGKHETTQLCIRRMAELLKEGDQVLDIGCGSGILSITALKLNAGSVTAGDIDEECLTSTTDNLLLNGYRNEDVTLFAGDLITDTALQEQLENGCYDLVVANILADVIIPMASHIPRCLAPEGIFVCSGIIDTKEDAVICAITNAGMEVVRVDHMGEWVGITARKAKC